jgi:hypothetical protein
MAPKPVDYDEQVIQTSAKLLYRQARLTIFNSVIIGVLIGATTTGAVGAGIGDPEIAGAIGTSAVDPQQTTLAVIISAIVGGVIGYFRGRRNAFKLRLQAQVALCQVQIERNTRVGSKDLGSGE